jgi:hypothetical protein
MLGAMRDCQMSAWSLFDYFKFFRKTKKDVVIAIVIGVIRGLSSGFGIPVILKDSSSILFGTRWSTALY